MGLLGFLVTTSGDIDFFRDETTQQVSLRVVHAMLRHLKESELMILLPSLVSFASSPSAICRLVMYDIFIWIYDNYRSLLLLVTVNKDNDDNINSSTSSE